MQDHPMRASVAAVAAALASWSAVAAAPSAQRIEAAIPGLKVQSIRPVAALDGLYEVFDANGRALYVDAALKVALTGEMFDIASRESLTEANRGRLQAVNFDSLPLELAIKRVKGNGSRRLAVFADPDCPYCAKFEGTLASIDDVTIFTFVYPLDDLHPQASERARAIWCAADRDAAWRAWLVERTTPPPAAAGCTSPAAQIAAIAATYRVQGTPSLVFGSGRILHGTQSVAAINRYLDEPTLPPATTGSTQADTSGAAAGGP